MSRFSRALMACTPLARPLLAGALLTGAAAAQAEPVAPPPIVVTGRGLAETPATPAYHVQDIDRDRLLVAASGRIEDALSAVAGFQQFRRSDSRSSNPSAQGVTLRALGGNATSRSLVLLDGVPTADPFFGFIPLSAIAPERLASARVTRGGGSGAFGAGAVAGTIELTSADAATLGLLSATALADDRGDTELSASLAQRLGAGFAIVSGRWDRGPGFATTPADQRVPATVRARYNSWSAGLRAVAPVAPQVELQARVLAFADRRTLRFRGADTGSEGQDASIRLVGRGSWQFDALAYVQSRNFDNVVISARTFLPTLDQRTTPSTGIGGKIELRPPLGRNRLLRVGADWRQARGQTIEDTYAAGKVSGQRIAGGTNADLGFFAESDTTLGPLLLTSGVRLDRWSVTGGRFIATDLAGRTLSDTVFPARSGWTSSMRGGAVLHAAAKLDLRGALYSGLRQPTLNELYRSFTVFPVTTQANAALRNERLHGFEGGFDWRPLRGVKLSATAFHNRVRDAIANVTVDANTRRRDNIGAIRARGVEIEGDVRLSRVSLGLSAAWTEARVEAPGQPLEGKRPAQTPRFAASANVTWTPRPDWVAALTLRHTGAQFEDDLETDVLKAATTLDAYIRLPLAGPVSLVLRGENLTDTTIVTRNAGGSIDTGAPRTLWAGLRFGL